MRRSVGNFSRNSCCYLLLPAACCVAAWLKIGTCLNRCANIGTCLWVLMPGNYNSAESKEAQREWINLDSGRLAMYKSHAPNVPQQSLATGDVIELPSTKTIPVRRSSDSIDSSARIQPSQFATVLNRFGYLIVVQLLPLPKGWEYIKRTVVLVDGHWSLQANPNSLINAVPAGTNAAAAIAVASTSTRLPTLVLHLDDFMDCR